jgi:hypothetical protein
MWMSSVYCSSFHYSKMVQITSFHGCGGFRYFGTLRRTLEVQCHASMSGRCHGLADAMESILTGTVSENRISVPAVLVFIFPFQQCVFKYRNEALRSVPSNKAMLRMSGWEHFSLFSIFYQETKVEYTCYVDGCRSLSCHG